MKVGVMGGTFDPIHKGHLLLGCCALEEYALDEIWIMPNGNPPHKSQSQIQSSAKDRLHMSALAIAGMERFRIEQYEVKKQGISYSYETMETLKQIYPQHEFYFIIGADSLCSLKHWVHPERLFKTCKILVAFRGVVDNIASMNEQIDLLCRHYQADIHLLHMPAVSVSSSELRDMLQNNRPTDDLISDSVAAYIEKKGLYQNGSTNGTDI